MRLHIAHVEAEWPGFIRISSILVFRTKIVLCTILSSATVTYRKLVGG